MKSTTKRININLTKKSESQLKFLMDFWGENYTQSISTCINAMHEWVTQTQHPVFNSVEHTRSIDVSLSSLVSESGVHILKQNDVS